jgi:hypothetical protein
MEGEGSEAVAVARHSPRRSQLSSFDRQKRAPRPAAFLEFRALQHETARITRRR